MLFDIFKNDIKINSIVADKEFCEKYCASNGYTYLKIEEEVSQPEKTLRTREDEVDAMLIEHEYRLAQLELGVSE